MINKDERNNLNAILTHDLKTPLTAQINVLELLSNGHFGKLTSEQEEILQQVISSAKLAQQMVNSILSSIKYEDETTYQLFPETFRLLEIIENVLAELKDIAKYKGNIINLHTYKLDNDLLYADKKLIKKAIFNMLLNSINCSKENGKIDIYIYSENNSIKFEVFNATEKTTITREKLTKLFNRYALREEKFRAIGTGLGMNLVKKIIEIHHGFVYCDVIKTSNKNFDIYEFGFELKKANEVPNMSVMPVCFQNAV